MGPPAPQQACTPPTAQQPRPPGRTSTSNTTEPSSRKPSQGTSPCQEVQPAEGDPTGMCHHPASPYPAVLTQRPDRCPTSEHPPRARLACGHRPAGRAGHSRDIRSAPPLWHADLAPASPLPTWGRKEGGNTHLPKMPNHGPARSHMTEVKGKESRGPGPLARTLVPAPPQRPAGTRLGAFSSPQIPRLLSSSGRAGREAAGLARPGSRTPPLRCLPSRPRVGSAQSPPPPHTPVSSVAKRQTSPYSHDWTSSKNHRINRHGGRDMSAMPPNPHRQ